MDLNYYGDSPTPEGGEPDDTTYLEEAEANDPGPGDFLYDEPDYEELPF